MTNKDPGVRSQELDISSYCRELESYLCRKNGGHLIRVVGPSFELVSGWAERGVPLKVAFRGVDRCCERQHTKGRRRRPVRIEFCEADVLDAFDEWTRAVGVTAAQTDDTGGEAAPRKPSLPQHLDRALSRLIASAAAAERSSAFHDAVAAVAKRLADAAGEAKHARGDTRDRLIAGVHALDAALLRAAVHEVERDPARAETLRREAEEELAPFRGRLSPDVRDRALASAYHRLVREALGLPVLTYE
jgi:hypothetical protein